MTIRDAIVFAFLILVLLGAAILGVALGTANVPPARSVRIIFATVFHTGGDFPAWQQTVLIWLRLPRVIVAGLAGGGLALTGAVMQAVFRNPMADPGIVGVSSGAAFGAVLVMYTGSAAFSVFLAPVGAFAGALLCAFTVYAAASSTGKNSATALLLSGVAIGSIVSALTSFLLAVSLRQWEVGRQMMSWLMGDLEGRSWGHVALAAPLVIPGCVALAVFGKDLNVLLTGEDNAMSLGIDVPRLRRTLLVWASLVTAATVAVAGSIGFIGLVVPHILRLAIGPDNRRLLPAAFLGGAIFLILADTACRSLALSELRPGVVTSLCGGPFFFYLLLKSRKIRTV